jgi:hypothetical protein
LKSTTAEGYNQQERAAAEEAAAGDANGETSPASQHAPGHPDAVPTSVRRGTYFGMYEGGGDDQGDGGDGGDGGEGGGAITTHGLGELCGVLMERLPTGMSKSECTARTHMFRSFDTNSNGYVSLPEVEAGIRQVFGDDGDEGHPTFSGVDPSLTLNALFEAEAVVAQAFEAAKNESQALKALKALKAGGKKAAKGRKVSSNSHFMNKVEFRSVLVYLRRSVEEWVRWMGAIGMT